MARFKLFPRYRRPSLKTALGVTKAKRRLGKATGYYALTRPLRAPGNFKRRLLRHAGYYSGPMKFLRFLFTIATLTSASTTGSLVELDLGSSH